MEHGFNGRKEWGTQAGKVAAKVFPAFRVSLVTHRVGAATFIDRSRSG